MVPKLITYQCLLQSVNTNYSPPRLSSGLQSRLGFIYIDAYKQTSLVTTIFDPQRFMLLNYTSIGNPVQREPEVSTVDNQLIPNIAKDALVHLIIGCLAFMLIYL